jgi:hypothetical protein
MAKADNLLKNIDQQVIAQGERDQTVNLQHFILELSIITF